MNCIPSISHSNARSSPLSNPIAASLFIKLDINFNNSNANYTLKNEYLNNRPSSEMSDSVSGRTPKKCPKKTRFKGDL